MLTVAVITRHTGLSPLQLRAAFRGLSFLCTPKQDYVLSDMECLGLWIFMLIQRFRFLTPEQQNLLFEQIVNYLPEINTAIAASATQIPMVVIADSRYATWHGMVGWLDLSDGNVLANTPSILETMAYNLTVLSLRNYASCQKISMQEAPRNAPHNTNNSDVA